MQTVETRSVTKVFGDVRAVDGIDLSAKEGEFLVLLGPSGCGKTTLMRMIAGLETPTSGRIYIGGEDVTDLPPRSRNIAMVFQSYALYPHLTVYKNIAFPLKARGADRGTIERKVQWAAEMFGIGHLLARRPRQLSGGERQRVALARAVVREPLAFLLDEPLSNLDAKLRTLARDELKQFQRRLGTTTIYVTHDQIEAMGLGDRIAVLNKGRICQIGTARAIYDDPADTFVATFIGSPPMNLIETEDVVLGIRPEHLVPKVGTGGPSGPSFPVHVTRLEYLGADTLIYGVLEPPFKDIHIISRLPSSASAAHALGDRCEFVAREADIRRFDPETGRRIDRRDAAA
ncbi:MAG TPA: ABC transporter ATP-binding protein [Alphaproteobacteria bacterium]